MDSLKTTQDGSDREEQLARRVAIGLWIFSGLVLGCLAVAAVSPAVN